MMTKLAKVTLAALLFQIVFWAVVWSVARAEDWHTYSNDAIANAIYKAENSTSHPYGILAHYKVTTPRQACINTIQHARRDWNGKGDFIHFLQGRYCPIGASNDPRGLNKNWERNVKRFLLKGGK